MKIILGQPSVESINRHFECKQGHRVLANSAPTIKWYSDANDGPPICPHCIIEFLRQMFPMGEIVAAPMVPATSAYGIPKFNPCKTENCILAFHGGNQHMNSSREFFTQEPQIQMENTNAQAIDKSTPGTATGRDKTAEPAHEEQSGGNRPPTGK